MTPELGNLAVVIALALAVIQFVVPMAGSYMKNPAWMRVAQPAAYGQFLLIAFAFWALTDAFLRNDFTVAYVAQNGNTLMPTLYKVSAVWGAHEGSLLLWALMLSGWSVAVAIFSRNLPQDLLARVLSVMGFISIGFLLFMLLTSNPFNRVLPMPMEGRELNPLLQDPGLAIHPPMLYMGYVGFSVAFAFAIAALLGGRLDATWARWSRPWTTVAWAFLTVGIALGSWWAYYELGWGGWWFWDPVENASFMPWLAGTALIHSLAVTEKRGAFRRWTVLLALTAFSLSLLGTFLVRSGVLTSVHAFASDPERGVFILGFLLVVIGGSLLLYAWRAPSIPMGGSFDLVSRETVLLGNNVLLAVATAGVLLGTLAPLIYDALSLPKLSVGFPYFNMVFIPLMVPLIMLIGIGPLVAWKSGSIRAVWEKLKYALLASLVMFVGIGLPVYGDGSWAVGLAAGLGVWVVWSSLIGLLARVKRRGSLKAGLKAQSRSYYGMVTAHIGVAILAIGVAAVSNYDIENDMRMEPGQSEIMSGYRYEFVGVEKVKGPNYTADQGTFRVYDAESDELLATLHPEKRAYYSTAKPMTEAGIDGNLFRDLYVSLGEPLSGDAWGVRLYYKPLISWIWLGAFIMAMGGVLAISDKRYRVASVRKRKQVKAGNLAAAAG